MSDNKQLYRWLSKYMPEASEKRLVVLTGARQTGKTTLVKKIYSGNRYINLDAPENRESIRSVSAYSWYKDVGEAVLDEAQKEPSIFEKVKYSYDSGKISFTAMLGSAQILLLHNIRETLAGRVFLYELWPLMLSEILAGNEIEPEKPLLEEILQLQSIDVLLNSKKEILLDDEAAKRKEAEAYLLKWGGMPELLHLNDDDKFKWLQSYEYTYLERDLSDLAKLKDLEPFRKFQKLTALRSAKLLNYAELSRDAGISLDSARRYLEYLKLSYQTISLQPFYENLTSSTVKSPKIYIVDIGILRQLAGFSGEINGEIYETYVISEIYKWIKSGQKNIDLFFYRTRSGMEIDLLIKSGEKFIGLEIKMGKKIGGADFSPMQAVAKKLGKRWLGGVCVYRGDRLYKLAEPAIWAVPSYRLFSP